MQSSTSTYPADFTQDETAAYLDRAGILQEF